LKIKDQSITFKQWLWLKRTQNKFLTPNQIFCTSILKNTAGFNQCVGGAYSETLTSSPDEIVPLHNLKLSRSLKVSTTGHSNNEGVYLMNIPVELGKIHKTTVYVKSANGATMRLRLYDNATHVLNTGFTADGTWQTISNSLQCDGNLQVGVQTNTTMQAIDFYLGCVIVT